MKTHASSIGVSALYLILISQITVILASAQHQESYTVSGAGDNLFNGVYVPDGNTGGGHLRWTNGTRYLVFIPEFSGLFALTPNSEYNGCCEPEYYIFDGDASEPPPPIGWTVGTGGTPPEPTVMPVTLPVELAGFSATAYGEGVVLTWSTLSENSMSGFEVQRRFESDFSAIGFVAAAGNSDSPRAYSYSVAGLRSGTYSFRLRLVDLDGTFSYSDEVEIGIASPDRFSLHPAYPNPFQGSTTLEFDIPHDGSVRLVVFNILGQPVNVLREGYLPAGTHHARFDVRDLPRGLYFARLETGGGASFVRQMVYSR